MLPSHDNLFSGVEFSTYGQPHYINSIIDSTSEILRTLTKIPSASVTLKSHGYHHFRLLNGRHLSTFSTLCYKLLKYNCFHEVVLCIFKQPHAHKAFLWGKDGSPIQSVNIHMTYIMFQELCKSLQIQRLNFINIKTSNFRKFTS